MVKKYLKNPLYKALKNAGFDDEYIEEQVEAGKIRFEKSMSEEDMESSKDKEEKNVENDKEHIKDLEKDEDEDDEKDLKKDEKEKNLEKSLLSVDLMKSMQQGFVEALKEVFQPQFDNINKSIEKIGSQTPSFKNTGLENVSFLEKSIDGMKDEGGKLKVSVTRQRPIAKALIEKALETADDTLIKSIGDDAKNYLINPEAITIGETLARYMYENQQVKFEK